MQVFKKRPTLKEWAYTNPSSTADAWVNLVLERFVNPVMVTCTFREKTYNRCFVEKTIRIVAAELRKKAYTRQLSRRISDKKIPMFVASIEEHQDKSFHVHFIVSGRAPNLPADYDAAELLKDVWEQITGNGNVQIDEPSEDRGGLKGLVEYCLKYEQRPVTSGQVNLCYWDYQKIA